MLTVIFSGSSRLIFSIGLVAMPPIGMSLVACCILPALPSLWGRPGEPLALGWGALTVVLLDALETILYLWKLICVKWWKSFAVGLGWLDDVGGFFPHLKSNAFLQTMDFV